MCIYVEQGPTHLLNFSSGSEISMTLITNSNYFIGKRKIINHLNILIHEDIIFETKKKVYV